MYLYGLDVDYSPEYVAATVGACNYTCTIYIVKYVDVCHLHDRLSHQNQFALSARYQGIRTLRSLGRQWLWPGLRFTASVLGCIAKCSPCSVIQTRWGT